MSEGAEAATYYTKGDTGEYSEASLPTFQESLPEDLRSNEAISGFETAETLAKAYLDTNTKYSELQASLPTVPESVDGYKFDIPAGTEVDQARVDGFKQTALKHKIPADVANVLVQEQLQYEKEARERATQEFNKQINDTRDKAEVALKKEWGVDFQANKDGCEVVLNRFASEKAREFIRNSGLGREPEFIKMIHEIKKVLSEDVLVPSDKMPADRSRTGEYGQKIFSLDKSFPEG